MKNFRHAIGYAVIMIMVGMCPIILSVLLTALTGNKSLEIIAMPICYLIGAVLCCFAAKLLHVETERHIARTQTVTLMLAIAAGAAWALGDLYIVNRAALISSTEETLAASDYIGALITATVSPAAEELIFRFGVLTLLMIGARRNKVKTAFAMAVSILPWMMLHFPKTAPRAIDIILTGIILCMIYILSKNVFYSIAFHTAANAVTMFAAVNAGVFVSNQWLLCPAVVIFAASVVPMFILLYKTGKDKAFQPMDTIKKI